MSPEEKLAEAEATIKFLIEAIATSRHQVQPFNEKLIAGLNPQYLPLFMCKKSKISYALLYDRIPRELVPGQHLKAYDLYHCKRVMNS